VKATDQTERRRRDPEALGKACACSPRSQLCVKGHDHIAIQRVDGYHHRIESAAIL